MRPINLSVRLPIVDLVGRYPTNYLIGREPIFQRIAPLISGRCRPDMSCGISSRFQLLSPSERQVAHALLARPPLSRPLPPRRTSETGSVRLACVRHAASVRPEPGSNSLKIGIITSPEGDETIAFQSFLCSHALCVFSRSLMRVVRILSSAGSEQLTGCVFRSLLCFSRCLIFKVPAAPLGRKALRPLGFRALGRSRFRPALGDSFDIIPHTPAIVNTFFRVFLNLLRFIFSPSAFASFPLK